MEGGKICVQGVRFSPIIPLMMPRPASRKGKAPATSCVISITTIQHIIYDDERRSSLLEFAPDVVASGRRWVLQREWAGMGNTSTVADTVSHSMLHAISDHGY